MKKVALSLLALAVVAVGAFADAPKWDPKVTTEIKGDASVTLGFDLDQGVYAFKNSSSAELVIDLVSGGDRSTASDADVWGEIKVKSDGDPIRLKGSADSVSTDKPGLSGFKVVVDYAKIHFGKAAYLSVTSHGTQIKYASSPDLAFLAVKFTNADRYGTNKGSILSAFGDTGASNAGGIELGYSLDSIASVTLAVGTVAEWSAANVSLGTKGDANTNNKIAYKAAVDVSALSGMGVNLGAGYSSSTVKDSANAVGAKASYKLNLAADDKLYVKPSIGVGMVNKGGADVKSFNTASAGVLVGTGGKTAAFDNYGLKLDSDYGSYPGVSFGLFYSDEEVVAKTGDKKADTGINLSANSGSLLGDTTVVFAYDMLTKAKDAESVITVGASSKVAMGDIAVSPKGMVSINSLKDGIAATGAMKKAASSSMFIKQTTDITGVIPFTTFTVNIETNDLSNGYGFTDPDTTKAVSDKMGKVEFTVKIAL